jgi:ankyrin repeat protein
VARSTANVKDRYGYLALHYAAHASVVKQLLLAAPQTAMAVRADGWLPLHFAARQGLAEVAQQVLQSAPAAAITACLHNGFPLDLAVARGHASVVEHLLLAARKQPWQ